MLMHFLAAIRFITVLPLGPRDNYAPRSMIPWFPLVGLMLGGMLSLFDRFAFAQWSPGAAAVLDVALLAVLTGGLHLDGLADTADGLYGERERAQALAIMKDSRIGAMGMLAVVFGLALKTVGIAGLGAERHWLLWLVPAFARGAMLFGICWLPYGRQEEGTGFDLFATPLTFRTFGGMLAVSGLSLGLGWRMVPLNLFFLIIVLLLCQFYRRKLGCITGDMLGAMVEVTEALLFLAMSMEVWQ